MVIGDVAVYRTTTMHQLIKTQRKLPRGNEIAVSTAERTNSGGSPTQRNLRVLETSITTRTQRLVGGVVQM